MSSVDNRIVNMQFNNKQFEAGISQTLTSLEELKQSLKFNTSVTGINAVSNALNGMSLRGISNSVDELTNRFSMLGIVGMTAIQNITNKVMNFATSKVSGIFGRIVSGGKTRAMKVTQAEFQLKGLLESAEDVKTAMESAQAAVDGTAYGLDAAVAVASQLAATGIDVGDELKNTLQGIAGTAAMTGDSFESIGNIFTTVAGNGRLMGMQLSQLSYHGLNAAAVIAKYLNTTEEEVRDMTSKGKISFEMFSAAMQDAFGEHAKDANSTLSGVLDNIGSALSRTGEIFWSGITDNKELIQFLGDVKGAINAVNAQLKILKPTFRTTITLASKVGRTLVKAFDATGLSDIVGGVNAGLESFNEFMKSYLGIEEVIEGETETVEASAEGIKDVAQAVTAVSEAEAQAAKDIWFGVNGRNPYGNGEARKAALEAAGLDYANVQGYVNALAAANGDLEKVEIAVGEAAQESMEQAAEGTQAATTAAESTQQQFTGVKGAMAAVMLFGVGINLIFNNIKKTAEKVAKTFKKVFTWDELIEDIGTYAYLFNEFVGNFELTEERSDKLERALQGLWSAIDLLRKGIKLLVAALSSVLGPVLSEIFDLILDVSAAAGDGITSFNEWVEANITLNDALKWLGDTVGKVINTIKTFFEKLWNLPAVQQIKGALVDLGETILDKLTPYLEKATQAVKDFFNLLTTSDENGAMDTVLDGINTGLETLISYAGDAEGAMNKLFGWFDDKKNSFVGFLGGTENVEENVEKIDKQVAKLSNSKGPAEFTSNFMNAMDTFGVGVNSTVDKVIDKFNQLDVAKLALLGFSSVFTTTGLSLAYLSYNVAEFVQSVTGIPTEITKTLKGVRSVVEELQVYMQNKSQAEVIRSWAITIAVLAGSLFLLIKLCDPDDLWNAAGALSLLLGILAIATVVITNTSKKLSNKNFFKGMVGISALFISMASSALILANALAVLADIKWSKDIIKTGIALIVLLGVLVGLAFALTKMDQTLPLGAAKILILSTAVWVIASAIKKLQDVDVETLPEKVLALAGVIGMLSLIAMAASKLKFVNALSILMLIGSIWAIELALMNIIYTGVSLDEVKSNFDKFIPVLGALGVLAAFMVTVGMACKKSQNIAAIIIATAIAIGMIGVTLQYLSVIPWLDLFKAVAAVALVILAIGLLLKSLNGKDFTNMNKIGSTLIKISVMVGILAIVVAALGYLPIENLSVGFLYVTALMTIVGLFVVLTSKYAQEIDFKALYAIVAAIGVLGLIVTLMSLYISYDPNALVSLLASTGIMMILLLSFGKSMQMASQYANRINVKSMMTMIGSLLVIVGSLFLLAEETTSIDDVFVAAVSIAFVLVAIGAALAIFNKAAGDKDLTKKGKLQMWLMIIFTIAMIAAAIYALAYVYEGDGSNVIASGILLVGTLASVAAVFGFLMGKIEKLSINKNTITTIKLMIGLIGVIGLLLAGLTFLIGLNDDGTGGMFALTAAASMLILAGGLMLVMAFFVQQVNKLKVDGKILGLIGLAIGLIVAVGTLIAVIVGVSKGNTEAILWAGLSMMGVMATILIGIGAFATYVKNVNTRTMVAIVLACAVVVAVGYALKEVLGTGVDWSAMIGAAVAMAIVLGSVLVAVGILTAIISHFGGIGLVAALLVFAGLAVVLKVLSGVIKTFATSVNIVVGALDHLSKVDLAAIDVKVLFELAGVVAAVGLACLVAGPGLVVLAAGLGAVALAVGALGLGVLTAVIPFGILALIIKTITDAIANLATTFDETGDSLQNGIAGIGTGIGNAFINFITTISTNMPKIIKTIGDGLNDGAKEFWAFVENAADILLTGLTNLANKAGEKLPLLSEAISNALYGVLIFIGSRVSDFAVAGGIIAAELFIGITNTLAEYAPEIIEAVYNLGTQLILALAESWSNHGGEAGDIFTIGVLSMIKGTGDFLGMDTSEIQGEIDQQKAELAEKSAESGKVVGAAYAEKVQEESSNMELGTGPVDTTEAEQNAGNAAKTVTKSFATNLTKDINFDGVLEKGKELFGGLDIIGGDGATSLIGSFNKGMETEVQTIDVSTMNEEFKKQMRDEGWEQQGDMMVRTVEKAVNESDVNLDTFNSTVADNLGDAEELKAQGVEDKDFYIEGLTDITDEDLRKLRESYARLGLTAHEAVTSKEGLDENSPSKKAIEASEFYVKGLIIGTENLSGRLAQAFVNLTAGASNAVGDILGAISSTMNADTVDWSPKVTPVLDDSQIGSISALLGNNSVFTLAADASLSVNNASQSTLAMQVQNLSDQVQKLANTDYSKMLDGVAINIDNSTNVDGTPLRKMSASYTVQTMTDTQQKYIMAMGGRA